jgi:large subunit ribosomal protein L6
MLKNEITVPEGIEVSFERDILTVRGKKGELKKEFKSPHVRMKVDGRKMEIASDLDVKKKKAVVGTWGVLVKNMFTGVTKGWKGELKLVYSHFPVKLKTEGQTLFIDNFLGEKSPRLVALPAELKVEIDKNTVFVSGLDKEEVGNMCAKIEQATKIRGYDKRVFQDGIYISRKPYPEGEDEK